MFEAVQRTDNTGKPYGKANNLEKSRKQKNHCSMSQNPLSLPHTCGETLQEIYWKIPPLLTAQITQKGFVFTFDSSNGGSESPALREINRQKRWHTQSQRPHRGLRKNRGSHCPSDPSAQGTAPSNRFWSWTSVAKIQQKTPDLPNHPP